MKDSLAGKKVLYVITKSNWGGAQAYVYMLAKEAKARSADVAAVIGGTGEEGAGAGVLAARLSDAGVRTIFLPSFARDISLMREWRAYRELQEVIVRERPDTLHVNSSKAGGLGALAGRRAGVPCIVFTAHGWAHREPRSLLARIAIWFVSWLTVLLSHRVIVVSKKDYDDAPVLFSHPKLVLIRNGIAPFPLKTRDEARRGLAPHVPGAELFSFWVIGIGELHPNKGFDTLIPAFTDIAREHPEIALVIMGEGSERPALEKLVSDCGLIGRVFLAGFVPESRSYLDAADLFVLPSRKEGLPFTLLEAGLAERAVIATRTGGMPEVIEDARTGLLVRSADVADLARALRILYEDRTKRASYAAALKAKVESDFSEAEMLDETLALY